MLLAFLVFVVLLAGVVAYAADNIGRRVGRKHLRLFGLRPKTTALLVAVGAGMGISLLSLLAFFVLNRQAIRNIEQADTLRVELGKLRRDVTAVRGDLSNVTRERDAANLRAGAARSEAASAQAQFQDASTRLERAQQQTRALQQQAGELGRKVSELSSLRARLEAQAEQNRRLLTASKSDLTAAQGQLEQARAQVQNLDAENTQAQQQADAAQRATRAAQAKAQAAQVQAQNAQTQAQSAQMQAQAAQTKAQEAQARAQAAQQRVSGLQAQIAILDTSRRSVAAQRDAAAASLQAVQAQRDAVQRSVASLRTDVANLRAQSQSLQAQNGQLSAQNTQLRSDSAQLQADNDSLRRNLSDSQATVTRLEDEYSRATSELTATRNAPTVYPRNAIVYGAPLASVRNLDDFLAQAGQAAAAKGVRATPAVQLSAAARRSLEATLRGLNTSTFVLCRASGNASAALPVDLSCDARNNTLLYQQGSVIRRGTIDLSGGDEALRSQVRDLLGDAVLDLTSKGVPIEYVLSGNLDTAQLVTALGKLADAGRSSAVVGVMPRADVKLGSKVSLYAALLQ